MGLWALAGGLNNLWYSNITAHRMNDALQCLCWGVINVQTINNNYQKNKRPYAWPEDFHPKSLFFFLVWKYWGFSPGLGHVKHGDEEMKKTCICEMYLSMYVCLETQMNKLTYCKHKYKHFWLQSCNPHLLPLFWRSCLYVRGQFTLGHYLLVNLLSTSRELLPRSLEPRSGLSAAQAVVL